VEQVPAIRRRFTAALIITVLLSLVPATATPAVAKRSDIRRSFCEHDWREGKREVRGLIRCAVERSHVPGGADKAIQVARRESGLRPRAYNSAGYAGLYQHSTDYWPGRARDYGFPRWSAFNGRANAIVSIRMIHRQGWSAGPTA
jgi:hypothetical protein